MSKQDLIDVFLKNPEEFSESRLDELLNHEEFTREDLKNILLRLFDKNDDIILNNSEAELGKMGSLNRKFKRRREKLFWKKINKGNYTKIILSEGDSWFQYPKFITDIIDHLNKGSSYAIKSHGYGGDWISNILFENEYIEDLSLIKPDVFLISGGGNDIVGGHRLAQLLNKRNEIVVPKNLDLTKHEDKMKFSEVALNKEFFGLLKLFKIQYKLLFKDVLGDNSKFLNLKIITQGYDYPIPSSKKGFGLNPLQLFKPLTNVFMRNGRWLNEPLLLRGYVNSAEKEAIAYSLIEKFNEVLVALAENYKNVYHIDSRGAVNKYKGWYNELHPTSKEFKKISKTFKKCIESNHLEKKVYKVIEDK
ncbi:hypothetical protein [Wenyingzhuangia sp. IMCC45467]